MSNDFFVYTDGASRGNPGKAAGGFLIYDRKKNLLYEEGEYLGRATNNEAEYKAVILALNKLVKLKANKAFFFLDSLLVVKQLNGEYKVKEPRMQQLNRRIKSLIFDNNLEIDFKHISRDKNKEADAIVNKVLDNLKN